MRAMRATRAKDDFHRGGDWGQPGDLTTDGMPVVDPCIFMNISYQWRS